MPPELGLQTHTTTPGFYTCAEDLSSGPQACIESLYTPNHVPIPEVPQILSLKFASKSVTVNLPLLS